MYIDHGEVQNRSHCQKVNVLTTQPDPPVDREWMKELLTEISGKKKQLIFYNSVQQWKWKKFNHLSQIIDYQKSIKIILKRLISCQASKVLILPSFFFLPFQRLTLWSHIFQMKALGSFLCNVYFIQAYNMHESVTPYFSTNVTQTTEHFQEKFHLDDQGLVKTKKESLAIYLWPGNTHYLLSFCFLFFESC